ncbi:MAG: L,D-transpeptidase family protein [Gaiellaceae bacterium]
MKRRILIGTAAGAVFFVVAGFGSLYAYDSTQTNLIAQGVQVGGVDVGGLRAGRARLKLEQTLAPLLVRTVTVDYRGRKFFLGPSEAHLRPDLDAMVNEAVRASRDGTFVGRAIRELSGGDVNAVLPAHVRYSPSAIDEVVRRVQGAVNRPAQDASIQPNGTNLGLKPSSDGLAVRAGVLRRMIVRQLQDPSSAHLVHVQVLRRRPKLSTARLVARYPAFITISRNERRLRFWRHLKLYKTYEIAVGRIGLETPAGLYHIDDKQIDPSWHVPKSAWAGALAGRVIPPGPDDPLKARWMGFHSGAGIHGTDDIASLGTAASHGCIRMSIPDVEELYPLVPLHTPIYIE